MFSALMILLAQNPDLVAIEALRNDPEEWRNQIVEVCGEYSSERSVLFSDTVLPRHGRLGIKLSGNRALKDEKEICLTGTWKRDPDHEYATQDHIIVTDAAVHPYYVLEIADGAWPNMASTPASAS